MKGADKCVTCNTSISNMEGSTSFNCPKCGEARIVRCAKCRKISARYTCPECGYEGP